MVNELVKSLKKTEDFTEDLLLIRLAILYDLKFDFNNNFQTSKFYNSYKLII